MRTQNLAKFDCFGVCCGVSLLVRPEHRAAGAADPAEWIDPLMKHQGLGYRLSPLPAAAHHGSSHDAAMVFQVATPRQLRNLTLGVHRLQFIYQEPTAFAACNEAVFVETLKTLAGFAVVGGVDLMLLDCVRCMHQAGGLGSELGTSWEGIEAGAREAGVVQTQVRLDL